MQPGGAERGGLRRQGFAAPHRPGVGASISLCPEGVEEAETSLSPYNGLVARRGSLVDSENYIVGVNVFPILGEAEIPAVPHNSTRLLV